MSVAFKTKIRAMQARLLSKDDFFELASLKSVLEVGKKINALEGYANVLSTSHTEHLSRHSIERSLWRALFADYKKLREFTTDLTQRGFIDAYFSDNEIKIIKTLLGMVLDERGSEIPVNTFDYLTWDTKKLAASKNIYEFTENLKDTKYYPAVKHLGHNVNVFQLETRLDLYYYTNLYDKCKNRKEMTQVKDIIGTQIDLRNIMWIYRFKRYFNFEPSEIYPYLIPVCYRLKVNDLDKLVTCKGLLTQSKLDELLIRPYKNIFNESESLEACYYLKMCGYFKAKARRAPSSAVCAAAYIFFKELEIINLTTIIEGVRYSLEPNSIMKHLYLGYL